MRMNTLKRQPLPHGRGSGSAAAGCISQMLPLSSLIGNTSTPRPAASRRSAGDISSKEWRTEGKRLRTRGSPAGRFVRGSRRCIHRSRDPARAEMKYKIFPPESHAGASS